MPDFKALVITLMAINQHQSDRLLVMVGLMVGLDLDLQSIGGVSEVNKLNNVDVLVVLVLDWYARSL
ncbi:hypothetical protein [Pseudanabaena minima]|uniref:hypothetical protein n=1 Tax=Pseudanabaena minima TaxID=890415 RepID=UPI003DA98AC0